MVILTENDYLYKTQEHPATTFCKITVRKSKYYLEISKAWEELKFLDNRSMFSPFNIKILQSMINEIVPISKLLLINPQPSQQEKLGQFRQLEG